METLIAVISSRRFRTTVALIVILPLAAYPLMRLFANVQAFQLLFIVGLLAFLIYSIPIFLSKDFLYSIIPRYMLFEGEPVGGPTYTAILICAIFYFFVTLFVFLLWEVGNKKQPL